MAVMLAFLNPWYYFMSTYYIKQHCSIVLWSAFLCFLYTGAVWYKIKDVESSCLFYWHTNLGCSVSLQLSCFVNSLCVFLYQGQSSKKVPLRHHYLDFSPFTYISPGLAWVHLSSALHRSLKYIISFFFFTTLSLWVWHKVTSKHCIISDITLLFYLHRLGTRVILK